MPHAGQNRFSWDSFVLGIQQAPERAVPGNVLDARNVWAPDGVIERRPGTIRGAQIYTPQVFKLTGSITGQINNGNGTYTFTVTAPTYSPPEFIKARLSAITLPTIKIGALAAVPMVLASGPPLTTLTNTLRTYTLTAAYNGTDAVVLQQSFYVFNEFQRPRILSQQRTATFGNVLVFVSDVFDEATAKTIGIIIVKRSLGNRPNIRYLRSSVTSGALLGSNKFLSTVVSIPEFNVLYATYGQTVYDCSLQPGQANVPPNYASPNLPIAVAKVNSNPDFVGPKTVAGTPIFSVDRFAQLAAFPRAGVIFYFSGFMFATQIAGEEYVVRYSAAAETGGYNVWPVLNFVNLDDQDGQQPKCLASLNEHLVVYKPRSIALLVVNSISATTGQQIYSVTRVETGIGCEAHNSILEVRGVHYFPAADGFYKFDGSSTPRKISTAIDKFYAVLGRGNIIKSQGVHWPEQHCVMWTVPQSGRGQVYQTEDSYYLIVFDYDAGPEGAWWIWDSLPATTITRIFDTDSKASIYIVGSSGLPRKMTGNEEESKNTLTGQTASATDIEGAAYILTHRLGDPTFVSRTAQELWLEQTTEASGVSVDVITNDDDKLVLNTRTVNFANPRDPVWGGSTWGGSTWTQNKRRERTVGVGQTMTGKHFQLRITLTNAMNRAWKLVRAALFLKPQASK